MRLAGGEVEVAVAAFGIESEGNRDRFDQRRFSTAIFADEKCYVRVHLLPVQVPHGREREWIVIERRDAIAFKEHIVQEVLCIESGHAAESLRDELMNDVAVDVRQPEIPARIPIRKLFVVETEQVKHRRVKVVDVHFVFHGGEAELVGGAVDIAAFGPATR
jgi:hypothetical protein